MNRGEFHTIVDWTDFSDAGYATLSAVVSVLSHYIETQEAWLSDHDVDPHDPWDDSAGHDPYYQEAYDLLQDARAIYDAWQGAGS